MRVRQPNSSLSDLRIIERTVAQSIKNATPKKTLTTFVPAAPTRPPESPSPTDTAETNTEENHFPDTENSESDQAANESTSEKIGDDLILMCKSPQVTRKQAIVHTHTNSNDSEIKDLEQSFVDLDEDFDDVDCDKEHDESKDNAEDSEKGLIDESTRKKLIEDAETLLSRSDLRKPKKLRTTEYRLRKKYLRRRNGGSSLGSGSGSSSSSFLFDEVIVEEDEEALEAENLEVISSRPGI